MAKIHLTSEYVFMIEKTAANFLTLQVEKLSVYFRELLDESARFACVRFGRYDLRGGLGLGPNPSERYPQSPEEFVYCSLIFR